MPRKYICLAIAAFLFGRVASSSIAADAPPAVPTCAVLAGPTAGLDSSPVVALLETKLSQDSGIRLLERAEIARILAEHSLSLNLAESTAKSRREWGQLLRARLLVLLHARQVKEGKVIEASFVETRHGLSLGSERLVWDDRAEQIASLLARRISQVAGTATADLKYVFAVPPFEAQDLSPDSLQYQSAYAQLVEEAVSRLPGVVTADLAHAAEMARELAVSEGETSVTRSLPYYLYGQHKMTGPTGNRTLSFHLELRRGQDMIASLNKDAVRPADAATFLRETCTSLARKAIGSPAQPPASGATALEADLLEERCRAYRLVGEWESSIRMAEAALLLDPQRHELHAQILDACEELVLVGGKRFTAREWELIASQPARPQEGIAGHPDDILREPRATRAFVQHAFAAIDHAQCLAHARSLSPHEVRSLGNTVSQASRSFVEVPAYDWKLDPSGFTLLHRELLYRDLDLVAYLLSSNRIAEDRFRPIRGEMADALCRSAAGSQVLTQKEWLGVVRRIMLAPESAHDSFRVQWEVASSVGDLLWLSPQDVRDDFLGELARRQEGRTRFVVECLRAVRGFRRADQTTRVRKELDAIASRAFPGQPVPPPQMLGVYRAFENTRRSLESEDHDAQREPAEEPAGSSEQTVRFQEIFDGAPRAGSRTPIRETTEWLALDGVHDLRVVANQVFVMDGPRLGEILIPSGGASWRDLGDTQWDGRYVWVSNRDGQGRLHVFEGTSWEHVATIDDADGLPAMDKRCKIAPLAPGRVCVVGGTGSMATQAWIGLVELSGEKPKRFQKKVEVFFSARRLASDGPRNSVQATGLDRGFLPRFAVTVRSAANQLPLVLVGREAGSPAAMGDLPVLLVDPAQRQVSVLPEKWGSQWVYVPGPDQLYVLTKRFPRSPEVAIVASARLPDTDLREFIALDLPGRDAGHFTAATLQGNLLHAIADEWFTVDVSRPRVVRKTPIETRIRGCTLTRSACYGLVAYDRHGAWQVVFDAGQETAEVALTPTGNTQDRAAVEGAMVAWLPDHGTGRYGSQAQKLNIAIGDVIVAVNKERISSAGHFDRVSSGIDGQARTIDIVGEAGLRTVQLQPGKIGVFLCDYRAACGPSLIAALRACREQQYKEAAKSFEEAVAAGLDHKTDDLLSLIYAHCLYYCGDAQRALGVLRERIELSGNKPDVNLWKLYGEALDRNKAGPAQNADGYLGLHLLQQLSDRNPDHVATLRQLAHYRQQVLRQYIAAMPAWFGLMDKALASGDSEFWCEAVDHLYIALHALKMKPEASAVCRYLVDSGRGNSCFGNLDEALLKAGEIELATRVWLGAGVPAGRPIPSNWTSQSIIAAHVQAGRVDQARLILKRLGPPSSPLPYASLMATSAFMVGWPALARDYAEYARRMLREYPRELEIQKGAFIILSHLPQPDVAELIRIHDQAESLIRNSTSEAQKRHALGDLREMKTNLSMLRGDYDGAMSFLADAPLTDNSGIASQREAAIFLKEHAAHLAAVDRSFLKTQYALRVPSRGWFLLTRDNRMGWADPDGTTITEIPLPDRAWTPLYGSADAGHQDRGLADIIRCSDSGKTIVVLGGRRTVYLLNPDRRSWTTLIRFAEERSVSSMEVHQLWIRWLRPVLDQFSLFMLTKEEPTREVVWPPARSGAGALDTRAMLSDGTWIVVDLKNDRKFFDLSSLCATALGHPVEIYETSDLKADGPAYLYTSQGVLKWRRADNQIVPVPFPDRTEPAPVFPLTEGGERLKDKVVRLAVLPDSGGAIYQLDLVEGKLTRDVGINECYPMTYWLQKPVEWNRQQVIDAVTRAGLPWPPPWLPMPTADSKPAKQ